ncbi:MAG: hypothetical protein AAF611_12325 [Bacteroidota bacterium]
MKKRKVKSLRLNKKSISNFSISQINGGIETFGPERCDFIITDGCGTFNCPPGTQNCPTQNTCPPPTLDCVSENTFCKCNSIITMVGITTC